jgi:GNAT superfamily N-acetyltransferase
VTTIRRATLDDAAELADLRWTWRREKYPEVEQPYEEFVAQFRTWWSGVQDTHVAVLATDDSRAVGMAFLALVARVPDPGNMRRAHADLQSVYVREDHRNDGIGTTMIRALIDYARESGCDKISVHSGTRAVGLYEREGFGHFERLLVLDLN